MIGPTHLTDDDVARLAERLHHAASHAEPLPMLSADHPDMTLTDGYRIQRQLIALHVLDGARLSGMKMGLTSKAKMEQMGVHDPIYGHLSSSMQLEDGGMIDPAAHCHPRVEPEIAFLMGSDLEGPTTAAQALGAVEWVCPALEVIDSRYRDFKFTLKDVVADNASSSRYVLGCARAKPDAVDLGNLGMIMSKNGVPAEIGSSAAIYEHPARSLAALANMLAPWGERLKAGQVVLAGGATAAITVAPGDRVELSVDGLSTTSLFVKAG